MNAEEPAQVQLTISRRKESVHVIERAYEGGHEFLLGAVSGKRRSKPPREYHAGGYLKGDCVGGHLTKVTPMRFFTMPFTWAKFAEVHPPR